MEKNSSVKKIVHFQQTYELIKELINVSGPEISPPEECENSTFLTFIM